MSDKLTQEEALEWIQALQKFTELGKALRLVGLVNIKCAQAVEEYRADFWRELECAHLDASTRPENARDARDILKSVKGRLGRVLAALGTPGGTNHAN